MTAEKPFELEGRVAVVTGAGSGIGRATAELLSEHGATVVCADIEGDAASAASASIVGRGGDSLAVTCDVSRRAEVDDLVRQAVELRDRLDIMCNVAGIIATNSVVDTEEAELDRVLATNLKGVFFGCQAAARQMTGQGFGSIVNMASAAIDTPQANLVSYAMAKAAVAQLTKTLAVEVGPKGVRVNAVAPGFVITGMTSRHFTRPDGSIDEELRAMTVEPMAARTPLKMVGEPSDIAYAVLYLVSDAAKFVTGQIMRPNGGVAMP